jgi:hypothetical protein
MALGLVETAQTGVERYLGEISDAQADVGTCVRPVEAEGGFYLLSVSTMISEPIQADCEQMKHVVRNIQSGVSTMGEGKQKHDRPTCRIAQITLRQRLVKGWVRFWRN